MLTSVPSFPHVPHSNPEGGGKATNICLPTAEEKEGEEEGD